MKQLTVVHSGAEYETRTRNTCLEGRDVPNYTNSALTRHIFNSYLLIKIQMLLKFKVLLFVSFNINIIS